MPPAPRRQPPPERQEAIERKAVERVRAGGMTIVAVADEPGLHETVPRRWVLECGEPGIGACAALLDGGPDGDLVGPLAGRSRGGGRPAEARDRAALDGARRSKEGRAHLRGGHPMRFGPDQGMGMGIATSGRFGRFAGCRGCPSAVTHAWRARPESARDEANRALLDVVRPGATPGAGGATVLPASMPPCGPSGAASAALE
jgi:hypothetical protein